MRQLTTVLLLGLLAVSASAQEPPWDPARVKACDRSCLTGIMDRYVDAMMKHDRTGFPLEPDTVMGRVFAKMSMMTCAQQVDTKAFSFMTKLRPRRVLILDEQKGLASAFPLFVQDGTRRYEGGYVGITQEGVSQAQ